MRKKIGRICLVLGTLMMVAAVGLLTYNELEDRRAGEAADGALEQFKDALPDGTVISESDEMPTIEIDGYLYIGYISFPSLGIELPVMQDWDYDRMKIAPCRYSGSYKTDDLVIMGHNYRRHLSRLMEMEVGEQVIFTDAEGKQINYTAVSVETLGPYAVEDMIESGYDLTVFTCTFGGRTRFTVRCMRAD